MNIIASACVQGKMEFTASMRMLQHGVNTGGSQFRD